MLRVYAALDRAGCGPGKAIECGVVTLDPVTGALAPDPAPAGAKVPAQAYRTPLLAHDPDITVEVAKEPHTQAARPNLLIKIPGTKEGLLAIDEAIAAGIPVNVTLLFAADQYAATADASTGGAAR